ncbi:hypothetical protein NDU88_009046 [Pleurodeles waltl]|uniref:Uncharacterized protein n=1 Tax=Pleurodeles waltl TaxID=8319 RepID=A0AAV7P5C5_PLEWA|nr:hypothetical protein NDU88_009046 [Pleurodeles waltl]
MDVRVQVVLEQEQELDPGWMREYRLCGSCTPFGCGSTERAGAGPSLDVRVQIVLEMGPSDCESIECARPGHHLDVRVQIVLELRTEALPKHFGRRRSSRQAAWRREPLRELRVAPAAQGDGVVPSAASLPVF